MMNAAFTPSYGPASILEVRSLPIPTPKPHEVLVHVRASAVTAGDLRVRSGDFGALLSVVGRAFMGFFGPRHPVQGTAFSGVVASVGDAVDRFAVGDAVFGSSPSGGAWAEYIAVPADGALARRPENVSHAEAAAVPYGAGTAWHCLNDLARVQAGERVLVLGGAGGVGRFAVRIARHLGAHVTAVGSRASLDVMRELGADEVLDYRAVDFATLGETWDVVFDTADASSFRHSRPVLTERGRYVTLYASLGVLVQMLVSRWGRGPRALFAVVAGTRERTELLADLLSRGAIRPRVVARFPIEAVAEAHRRAEQGAGGDVLVVPSASPEQAA
ncbi:MAG: NAD(P)-dependent alcohol dehydrogenase [Alphaproteobacteria bacterium]|nr:NAD(P)-dependent alcohol dehydrogenase [Alphaproteobacteria bacterium]